MKTTTTALLGFLALLAPTAVAAATIQIDLSPASGALNLGSTTYTQDHAIGMASANETAQPVSVASGNEFGAGITYDDVANMLSFDMAYGSAFGFVDLQSDFLAVHFHSPGAVNFPAANTSAGVIIDLAAFHAPSGTRSGRITGTVGLSAAQETQLLDNLIYVNVHSVTLGAGELRGQLVPVPEPATVSLALLGSALLLTLVRRRPAR